MLALRMERRCYFSLTSGVSVCVCVCWGWGEGGGGGRILSAQHLWKKFGICNLKRPELQAKPISLATNRELESF